jgi:2-hydroxychromene-2-carboxylate isomerase
MVDRREIKRPPAMGEMKRIAAAQAPTLRAELRAVMQLDGLSAEDVARLAGLDGATLAAFLEGASINPRWQEKLARWLERAGE